MTKYTMLTSVSMILTIASVSLVIALEEYDGSESVVNVIITATTTNVLIDILSVSLSFKFYEKYYHFCCQCSDAQFRRCCSCLSGPVSDEARLARTVNADHVPPAVVLELSTSTTATATTPSV